MRIAFLSTFYPYRGGIAQFNASLYNAFKKTHDIKAYTFSRQYPQFLFPGKSQFVQEGDKAAIIESEMLLDTINPFSYQKTANRIRSWKPDLLVMKYWMSFFGPSLGWVARQMDKQTKVITILDNVVPHEQKIIDKPFTSFFLKQNHGFVTMSEKVESDLLKLKPGARFIKHLHPIYDHFGEKIPKGKAREQLNIPKDKKVILFFGFIRDYKVLDVLLSGFSKLTDEYYLVIAGEPYGSFNKYNEMIKSCPNKENIRLYVEYISDDMVPKLFSLADVCVLPYKSATQSGITYISYHFDLPVIATDVGGLRETIRHKQTGFIIDKPDPGLLSGAINTFFENKEKTDYVTHIKQLKKDLSWDHLANAIVDFSRSLGE